MNRYSVSKLESSSVVRPLPTLFPKAPESPGNSPVTGRKMAKVVGSKLLSLVADTVDTS